MLKKISEIFYWINTIDDRRQENKKVQTLNGEKVQALIAYDRKYHDQSARHLEYIIPEIYALGLEQELRLPGSTGLLKKEDANALRSKSLHLFSNTVSGLARHIDRNSSSSSYLDTFAFLKAVSKIISKDSDYIDQKFSENIGSMRRAEKSHQVAIFGPWPGIYMEGLHNYNTCLTKARRIIENSKHKGELSNENINKRAQFFINKLTNKEPGNPLPLKQKIA